MQLRLLQLIYKLWLIQRMRLKNLSSLRMRKQYLFVNVLCVSGWSYASLLKIGSCLQMRILHSFIVYKNDIELVLAQSGINRS